MAPRLALLLHMHQPEYRDPDSGEPHMPWVRLHASRGYTDVARIALETGARPTVNVVPSLLLQLQAYARGGTDRWERLSRVEAESLHGADLDFVRRRFVHGHPSLREASPRYMELARDAALLRAPQDLRDLQVWSNLAWMGSVARRDPFVRDLVAQDRDFDHTQLLALMDRQRALVEGVIPLWRQLPSLSCSPLCHPILPLLVDFRHARRCMPGLPADLGEAAAFQAPEDALRQLVEARQVCAELLGRAPEGLWPSEGALSPEVLELAAEAGYRWVASDEGLLHSSDRDAAFRLDGPWLHQGPAGHLALLFRDRDLSDRIGFRYHHWGGLEAVSDLLHAAGARWGGDATVPVILDGENPWEAYPDAGRSFLTVLFGSGRVVSLDEAARAAPRGRVTRLHTGSWIGADLHIWAGDEADRRGWGLLVAARAAWRAAGCPEAGWTPLANAESSDWFWWLGPEFHTEVADLFDALFRAHLAAVWRAAGQSPPLALGQPVGLDVAPTPVHRVSAPMSTALDARLHAVDWLPAAPLALPRQGAMARGQGWIQGGAVGLGEGVLWLRVDAPGHGVGLRLLRPDAAPLDLDPAVPPPPGVALARANGSVILRLPVLPGPVHFALEQAQDGAPPERHPPHGWLQVAWAEDAPGAWEGDGRDAF